MSEKARKLIYGFIGFFVLIGFDQFTKSLAMDHLALQDEIDLIPGVFSLHYLENHGAAFGILQNKQWVFLILGVVFLVIAAFIYWKMPVEKRLTPLRVTCVFMAAGAVGNMIDRIFYHYVIDFFDFYLINFPIFNVADIYITVSCAFLLILVLFVYKDDDFEFLSGNKKETKE